MAEGSQAGQAAASAGSSGQSESNSTEGKRKFAREILLDAVDYAVQSVKAARVAEFKYLLALTNSDHSAVVADQIASYFTIAQTFADLARKGADVATNFSGTRTLVQLYTTDFVYEERMRIEHFMAIIRASRRGSVPSLLDQPNHLKMSKRHCRTNSDSVHCHVQEDGACSSSSNEDTHGSTTGLAGNTSFVGNFKMSPLATCDEAQAVNKDGNEGIRKKLCACAADQAEDVCKSGVAETVQNSPEYQMNEIERLSSELESKIRTTRRSKHEMYRPGTSEHRGRHGDNKCHHLTAHVCHHLSGNVAMHKQWAEQQAYFTACRNAFWPVLCGVKNFHSGVLGLHVPDGDVNPLLYIDESPEEPLPRPARFQRLPPEINIRRIVSWEFRPAAKYLENLLIQPDDEAATGASTPPDGTSTPPIEERLISLESVCPRLMACSVQWPPNRHHDWLNEQQGHENLPPVEDEHQADDEEGDGDIPRML